ncbi:hypothetical protein RFI_29405 [Reticulomyxa filosa]|uniref:Uncharacterized protein n=1 Tax=Reticulomyxa filosa TaxID=46433 RepID=X6M4L8_RETFI|nr:hypothetical protein RFI_29405 [Reticulomyxa filosa]|eukprot:ETO07985.1 hypothetical protein RFI_29405 [Reticulomyxa filosa]
MDIQVMDIRRTNKKKSDLESDAEEENEQYGTMLVNKAQSSTNNLYKLLFLTYFFEVIEVKSIFEGSGALLTELVIPSSMSKSELIASWNELKRQHQKDKQLLDDYYKKQVEMVEEKMEE